MGRFKELWSKLLRRKHREAIIEHRYKHNSIKWHLLTELGAGKMVGTNDAARWFGASGVRRLWELLRDFQRQGVAFGYVEHPKTRYKRFYLGNPESAKRMLGR
jgi:hypothetical protein